MQALILAAGMGTRIDIKDTPKCLLKIRNTSIIEYQINCLKQIGCDKILVVTGYNSNKIKVLIHQFVSILKNGSAVKMSTRKANFITLDKLIDEVGVDAVRYFFIMRSMNSHLNFEIPFSGNTHLMPQYLK